MKYISEMTKEYPKSGIRVMFDLVSKYPDAINLTLGEPNFDTPEHIKQSAIKAIEDNMTRYSANAGLYELRQAIANKYTNEFGEPYSPENVMVTVGAMEAIFLTLMTIFNPGDEIIIPDPAYPNYIGAATMLGCKIVRIPLYEENEFKLQPEDLEKAITPKTRALLLNYPNNPLGAILEKEDVEKLAKVVKKHDIIVISDEVYDKIIYDENKHFSMAQIPEVKKQVLIINGFSKTYAMTGWRLGYIVGDEEIISNMPKLQESIVSCIPMFIQKAAADAINGSQEAVDKMVNDYYRRRDILVDGLNDIPGFKCLKSGGSFYAFANIKFFGKTSQEFAEEILREAKVAGVPGSAFGEMGEGYMRFSFANSDENLKEAVRRIKEYVVKKYN